MKPATPLSLQLPFPAAFSIFYLLFSILVASLCRCSGPRPLRGGRALTSGPVQQSLAQSDNPSAASRQHQEAMKVRAYTLPAGTVIQQPSDTDPVALRESLLSDADKFTCFVNAMVRLAEGGISDESLRIAEEKLKLL